MRRLLCRVGIHLRTRQAILTGRSVELRLGEATPRRVRIALVTECIDCGACWEDGGGRTMREAVVS